MRRKCGNTPRSASRFVATCIAAAALLLSDGADSPAQAGFLEGGKKAWDRSGLVIKRPPRPGSKRFARPPAAAPRPAAVDTDWFWREITPGHAGAGPARFAEALDLLRDRRARHGGAFAPDHLDRIGRDWGRIATTEARRRNLSEALLFAVMAVESAGRPRARSPKGAQGLMQLIPATARRFGVADAYDPAQNVAGGAAYLDWLLRRFGGDVILALAGYNAGEGAVDRHGGVPPYAETRAYVVKVLDALVAAERVCGRAPESPRAPCARPEG